MRRTDSASLARLDLQNTGLVTRAPSERSLRTHGPQADHGPNPLRAYVGTGSGAMVSSVRKARIAWALLLKASAAGDSYAQADAMRQLKALNPSHVAKAKPS